MKKVFYIYIIVFALSCKQSKLTNKNSSNLDNDTINKIIENDTINKIIENDTINKIIENDTNKESLKELVTKIDSIKIQSFRKGYMTSSLPDSSICNTWNLKREDLISLLKIMKQIDPSDLHYLFETQTCIYKGIFEFEGREYTYGINSGGWLHLEYGDIILGCFDEKCEKYFLGKVDRPEEEFKPKN